MILSKSANKKLFYIKYRNTFFQIVRLNIIITSRNWYDISADLNIYTHISISIDYYYYYYTKKDPITKYPSIMISKLLIRKINY